VWGRGTHYRLGDPSSCDDKWVPYVPYFVRTCDANEVRTVNEASQSELPLTSSQLLQQTPQQLSQLISQFFSQQASVMNSTSQSTLLSIPQSTSTQQTSQLTSLSLNEIQSQPNLHSSGFTISAVCSR
jgi:hypothetical protein